MSLNVGIQAVLPPEASTDLTANMRRSMRRTEASSFIPHMNGIRGSAYEVESGRSRSSLERAQAR